MTFIEGGSVMIRAAGVVLWRERRPFELEIALVHRAKFDDWTFPKGKIELGESPIFAAFREVKEETGHDPKFGPFLGVAEYEVDGEKKRVQYWMAKSENYSDVFTPNDEIDRMEWVNIKQARHFLTYDVDREILNFFRDSERHGNVLILLRHAKALKRVDWNGDDSDRPLNNVGQVVAEKLKDHLSMFGIDEVHSSDAYRCISTIKPIVDKFGLKYFITDQLSEYLFEKDDLIAQSYVKELAKFGGNYLVCSHNPILPIILDRLLRYPENFDIDADLEPGDAWVVHHRGGRAFAVNYLKAPVINGS